MGQKKADFDPGNAGDPAGQPTRRQWSIRPAVSIIAQIPVVFHSDPFGRVRFVLLELKRSDGHHLVSVFP
jgi:hypothetical protein